MEVVVFYLLALVAVGSALIMVTARHVINSVLALVVTMFSVGGFYIMLSAPFLAVVQLIVYAGAVMVLYLFVLMLLDLRKKREKFLQLSPIRILGALLAGLFSFLMAVSARDLGNGFPEPAVSGTIEEVGALLFTRYYYLFEVAGILLTAALVGAVILSQKARREE